MNYHPQKTEHRFSYAPFRQTALRAIAIWLCMVVIATVCWHLFAPDANQNLVRFGYIVPTVVGLWRLREELGNLPLRYIFDRSENALLCKRYGAEQRLMALDEVVIAREGDVKVWQYKASKRGEELANTHLLSPLFFGEGQRDQREFEEKILSEIVQFVPRAHQTAPR